MDINTLVKDWAWRVNDGMPDPKNRNHIELLEAALRDHKYSDEFIHAYIQSITEGKGKYTLEQVRLLGGDDITQDSVDKLNSGKIKDYPILGNKKFSDLVKWGYKDFQKYMSQGEDIIITTASSVKKPRNKYGEQLAHLDKPSSAKSTNSNNHLGRVQILLKLSQLSGVTLKPKMGAGLGYEKMQADQITSWVQTNIPKGHDSLPLYIAGQSAGVNIDGAAKIDGSPKADLALGIGGKPNFFVSYKQGAMYDAGGKELKASFQQYGSIKSFYGNEFSKQVEARGSEFKSKIDDFVNSVAQKIKSIGNTFFEKVTGVEKDSDGKIFLLQGEIKTEIIDKKSKFVVNENLSAITKRCKSGATDLYLLGTKAAIGWQAWRSCLDMGKVGEDITLMSIFGNDYFSGTASKDNCDILIQAKQKLQVGFAINDEGNATQIHISPSSAGHIMWNPKIHGGGTFPKFGKQYLPFLVARYTGETNMDVPSGGFMIGVRLLIMPASHVKEGKSV
jgi:hypothetical protein